MIGPRQNQNITVSHNELYGHATILRRYMRVEDSGLLIAGQVQHGWTSKAGGISISPMPIYVWNDRTYEVFAAQNIPTERIGAPFLYLPDDSGEALQHVPRSLLAFPQHSTPGYPFQDRFAGLETYANWLCDQRARHDLSQITVCLAMIDYDDIAVTHMLRKYGLVVASCGGQFEPRYLYRQRAYMKQHDIVTSNTISTALMYAASLGRPVFVGGPLLVRKQAVDHRNEHLAAEPFDQDWIKSFGLPPSLDLAKPCQEIGAKELGLEHKKTPHELWNLMQLFYPRAGP